MSTTTISPKNISMLTLRMLSTIQNRISTNYMKLRLTDYGIDSHATAN
ncbi:hypothetical protein SAMN04488133_3383 [Halobellus limi]|uniref:Uncharacterized protein n=1 Tax=Halobellus limi TaxID=699433 RepID=A0A1H6CED9_9EURY|nr:hypothetical protein SAMN04488133_3383 [Halobellus limi]